MSAAATPRSLATALSSSAVSGNCAQRLRQPRAIDAGAAPEIGVGAVAHAARGGLDARSRLPSPAPRDRIEQRIAKARHRLGALLTARANARSAFRLATDGNTDTA